MKYNYAIFTNKELFWSVNLNAFVLCTDIDLYAQILKEKFKKKTTVTLDVSYLVYCICIFY